MKNNEKASFQVLKIAIILFIFLSLFSIGFRVLGTELNNVKIILSDNYEMNVLTTKSKISEILEENHIILLPDEKVTPEIDGELTENKTIIISKNNKTITQIADESTEVTLEEIMNNYTTITEKIVVKDEEIPYETITKNSSSTGTERGNEVIQAGKNGIKRITYKIKYQNDEEIEKTVLSEEIIKKPVNKIVQVITAVSSRSGERTVSASSVDVSKASSTIAKKVEGIDPIVKVLNTSAYTASTCGKSPTSKGYGITASGAKATAWYTVAAGKGYPMGTVIYIPYFKNQPNGGWFVVQDRGGAISNNKLDIYMNTYNECIKFGRRNLECYIYVP